MLYQRPKGTRDLFGKELRRIEALCSRARLFFEQHGYDEMKTPTFESAQLFDRSIGESTDIVEHEMYTFEVNKRLYALRPEGTASIVRSCIENKISLPARFLYIASMYRRERPQKGRYREFLQIGVEILGEGDPFYDAEIIDQAKRFLDTVSVHDVTIELNSIGCPHCRMPYRDTLRRYLAPSVSKLCANCQRRIGQNFLRIFDCKEESCQRIYDQAPKITDHLCQECREHYAAVKSFLKAFGIAYSENRKLVRGLDYYTRTVVEFKHGALGSQDTILAGGRYDLLMKELGGTDSPCTGWAMGVDRLLLALPENAPEIREAKRCFIATIGERFVTAGIEARTMLQNNNHVCIMGNPTDSVKSQLKKAHRVRADYAIIYGEDEAQALAYTVKDMKTGTQERVPMKDFSLYSKKLQPVSTV